MKRIIIILVFLSFYQQLQSQDWESTWTQAQKKSALEKKPILLIFSGSDWCAPCIKLERDIWTSDAFKAFAKEQLILYKADFPRKKTNQLTAALATQNKFLAATFNAQGYFPLVVLTNHTSEILGETGYKNIKAQDYITLLKSMYEE
jgi:thioredoxin-related protein